MCTLLYRMQELRMTKRLYEIAARWLSECVIAKAVLGLSIYCSLARRVFRFRRRKRKDT